jgi:hypothetical protein
LKEEEHTHAHTRLRPTQHQFVTSGTCAHEEDDVWMIDLTHDLDFFAKRLQVLFTHILSFEHLDRHLFAATLSTIHLTEGAFADEFLQLDLSR